MIWSQASQSSRMAISHPGSLKVITGARNKPDKNSYIIGLIPNPDKTEPREPLDSFLRSCAIRQCYHLRMS
jgi:hypothetical protein